MNTFQGRINHSSFGRANIMQTAFKFNYKIIGWANAHPVQSVPFSVS